MWLELTDADGEIIYVNMDTVTDFFDGLGDPPRTLLNLAPQSGKTIYVKESAREIMNMIVEEQRRLASLTKTAH